MMKAWKKFATGVLTIAATLPVAAFTLEETAGGRSAAADQQEAAYAYQYANLDELIPSVQYKSDWSIADNAALAEWYADHGIELTWQESDGGSHVIADHQNDAARDVRLAYYDTQIGQDFPPDEVAAVNAEVDAIIDALAVAGIDAAAPFDEEGFKDLMIDISPSDPGAQDLWDRANATIADVGN